MPYLAMNYPEQPIPSRLPLYRGTNLMRKSGKAARRARHANPDKEGSAFVGLLCAILFDLTLAAMSFGLWEILNHIL